MKCALRVEVEENCERGNAGKGGNEKSESEIILMKTIA